MNLLPKKDLDKFIDSCMNWAQEVAGISRMNEFYFNDRIKSCESPIEQIMFVCLWYGLENGLVIPQYKIDDESLMGKKYRVDFLVIPRIGAFKIRPLIIVECDGKEFHDVPERIREDRKRDRSLSWLGYKVFRFSGNEIWNFYQKVLNEEQEADTQDLIYEVRDEVNQAIKLSIRPESLISTV